LILLKISEEPVFTFPLASSWKLIKL
jgi:hypothetical protein